MGEMSKTPEEIKKGLECFSNNWIGIREGSCGDCKYLKTEGGSDATKGCKWGLIIIDAIDCIRKLEAQAPKWISVEEGLPTESDGTVLVCFPDVQPYNLDEPFVNAKHDRRVRTATYSQYSKQWYIGDMCAVGKVSPTYWMPLPQPPKEG